MTNSIGNGTWRITTDSLVEKAAHLYIDQQYKSITDEQKTVILPTIKYNVLATGLNLSSALLVAAVASAIFFTYAAAVVLGATALFTRSVVEKEIIPLFPQAGRTEVEVAQELLRRLGTTESPDWRIEKVLFLGYRVWLNLAPVPNINLNAPAIPQDSPPPLLRQNRPVNPNNPPSVPS